jgi:hypothetical protein
MKLNDFKPAEQKLDELRLSSLVGDYGSAALKSLFGKTGGKSTQQQMAQDIFIKDFVGDAISSLETGIKSGLINPSARGTPRQVNPASVQPQAGQPGATTPTAPTTPTTGPSATGVKSTAPAVGKFNQQKQTTQNMNQYIQKAAQTINATPDKAQKVALTKELVNYMADRKGYPEWENGLATVQQVIKRGNIDPNFANAALSKMKAGQTMAEAWKIFYINKLLESVKLSWKDVGLSVLKESTSKNYIIVESKYLKLNNVFESIVEAAKGQSIQDYLQNWFAQYMQGVNYSSQQQMVDKLINNVAKTYAQDKGKGALESLAQSAWALSKGSAPGAANVANQIQQAAAAPGGNQPQAAGQTQPATATNSQAQPAQMNSQQMAAQIKQDLAKLSKVDPKLYSDLIKSLAPASAPAANTAGNTFQDKPAATTAAPAQQVAESKRRTK